MLKTQNHVGTGMLLHDFDDEYLYDYWEFANDSLEEKFVFVLVIGIEVVQIAHIGCIHPHDVVK